MNVLWAIAVKDLRLLVRDRGAAFFTFGFPLIVAVLFGYLFGGAGRGGGDLDVGVCDEDGGPAARAFVADLEQADGITVRPYATRAEAENAVRRGDMVAGVIVPSGFQDQADNLFGGGGLKIEGLVDPRRQAEAGLIEGKLNEVAFKQMSRAFTDVSRMGPMIAKARESVAQAADLAPDRKRLFAAFFDTLAMMTAAQQQAITPTPPSPPPPASPEAKQEFVWRPVQVTVRKVAPKDNLPQSAFEITFPQGIVWGLMGCVTGFGASMASERSGGTLMRLAAAPISGSQVLLGKALGCFLACLLVQALLLSFGLVVFRLSVREPALLVAAMVSSSVGFVGVMMIMAALTRTEGAAQGLGRGLVIVLAMVGGGTVPLDLMPPMMQTLSYASPFKWATLSIEGAVWRGYTPLEMLFPCVVLMAIGVAGYAIGAAVIRLRQA